MFIVFASTLSMASTNETKNVLPEMVETTTTSNLCVDDGWWMCIEMSRITEYSYFLDTTVITVTYRCWWMEI